MCGPINVCVCVYKVLTCVCVSINVSICVSTVYIYVGFECIFVCVFASVGVGGVTSYRLDVTMGTLQLLIWLSSVSDTSICSGSRGIHTLSSS